MKRTCQGKIILNEKGSFALLRFAASFILMIPYLIFLQGLLSCKKNITSTERPNILFIMADDHAVQSISCYNNRLIETPGIDRLAREGMKFTNCFTVNSLCAPSRAALVTGKFSSNNGVLRIGDRLDENQLTFPVLLQETGYRTALIGKWHLISEPQGFDYYCVLPAQGRYFNCPLKEKGQEWQDGNQGGIPSEGFVTDVITDKAIDWLKKNSSEKPFFLMVHHKAPHTPHEYPDKFKDLYTGKDLPLPETFYDDYQGKNPELFSANAGYSRLDHIYPAHFREKVPDGLTGDKYKYWAYQSFFKGYLRLVASLDENVARLLDYLDESGLSENTMVVYTSDNGFFHGEHGLFNKMWMYEESMRLPLLIRYPGVIEPGTINEELVSILDFAPTFLDIAETGIPQELQGKSIAPLLTDSKSGDWRDVVFYHYFGQFEVPDHYGIRSRRYKLIHFPDTTGHIYGELYDLTADKFELENLFYNASSGSIKSELTKKLNQIIIQSENCAVSE